LERAAKRRPVFSRLLTMVAIISFAVRLVIALPLLSFATDAYRE
jgi:hypothetical protein